MRSALVFLALLYFLCVSCTSKPANLSDQLKMHFQTRIQKIDSTLVLDSFSILRIDTANQRLFSALDDTLYKVVLARVRGQMANATKNQNIDSMAIYQYELDYMIPTSDSLTKEISKSDTTKKYGIVVACQIQLRKDSIKKTDRIYYFLDREMTIRNGERIDSAISRISQAMHLSPTKLFTHVAKPDSIQPSEKFKRLSSNILLSGIFLVLFMFHLKETP